MTIDEAPLEVWSATLQLEAAAHVRLRELASTLDQDALLLAVAGETPLNMMSPRGLGQMMSLGEFATREDLVRAFEHFAEVIDSPGVREDLFTTEELDGRRRRRQLIERSEQLQRRTEEVQRLADEGEISRSKMVERLVEMGSEDLAK